MSALSDAIPVPHKRAGRAPWVVVAAVVGAATAATLVFVIRPAAQTSTRPATAAITMSAAAQRADARANAKMLLHYGEVGAQTQATGAHVNISAAGQRAEARANWFALRSGGQFAYSGSTSGSTNGEETPARMHARQLVK